MPSLENANLQLYISDDALTVVLEDRRRNRAWQLDPRHTACFRYGDQDTPIPLGHATVAKHSDRILVRHHLHDCPIEFAWSLHSDHVAVTLSTNVPDIEYITLPGSFTPAPGSKPATAPQAQASPCLGSASLLPADGFRLAIPFYQGVLLSPRSNDWHAIAGHHGHYGLTMSMFGLLTPHAGLLVTHDSDANWKASFGQSANRLFAYFRHQHCPVDGWVDATVRLYPTDPNLPSLCKRYRARLIERNRFVTWDQKIAAKPIVRDLFGSVFAFIGYNHTTDLDYVHSAQAFKNLGFDSAFYFPARFCCYSDNFKMGGDDPIHLSDSQIDQLHAIPGTHLSPWGWIIEALDEPTAPHRRRIFRHDQHHQPIPNWKIDDFQWYWACTPYQIDHLKHRLAADMQAMDWLHFDVNAMLPGMPCFNTDHAHHAHKPMGRRDDLRWTQQLFSPPTVGNRVVSSEGLSDHYAPFYDVGTTKMLPPAEGLAQSTLVPMSSLVLHDSCIHDWWEVHNYNANPGFPLADLPHNLGRQGSGLPHLKAALDALHGYPPSLFPFGKQYAWIDIQKRTTYSFLIRLEDPPVQEAIAAALPVAKLHKTIGPLEMIDFELLSDDGALQRSTFADGTRVVANLADKTHHLKNLGPLDKHHWRAIYS
ncbi:MAG: hypothetical protein IT443_07600 [Phycisphaeraceae bacterium]|nr:hypothetical protein [Phycisphaeraceae bacterium]